MSLPHLRTWKSVIRPFSLALKRRSFAASTTSGWVLTCPTNPPGSIFITLNVIFGRPEIIWSPQDPLTEKRISGVIILKKKTDRRNAVGLWSFFLFRKSHVAPAPKVSVLSSAKRPFLPGAVPPVSPSVPLCPPLGGEGGL